MRKSLDPFASYFTPQRQSIGGARSYVQTIAETMARSGAPMTAARIYSPPAIANYDASDPRYEGKSDNVENIYLVAAPESEKPRSGVQQLVNWLLTGRMR